MLDELLLVVGGLVLLVVGQVMVDNGVALAAMVGIPEYVLGLLTGLGTTAPELVVAGLAAYRGAGGHLRRRAPGEQHHRSGLLARHRRAPRGVTVIDPQGTVSIQYMLVGSLLVLALTYWREGLSRRMGVHCILLYLPSFVVL